MAFDPVEYIKTRLREYDPTLDLSGGSALFDLLVAPQSSILGPFNDTHIKFGYKLSLSDLNSLSDTDLENIASNFLISKTSGSKATGYVRIYFRDARRITIAAGTEFQTSQGLKFFSVNEHSVTQSQMLGNAERYPYYHTGDILVQAEKPGLEYQVGPESINTVKYLGVTYSFVTNINSMTGGADADTKESLYDKIVKSAYGSSLNSKQGIKTLLTTTFSNIDDVLVIGSDSALMLRDIVQDTTNPNYVDYAETDFRGKTFGQNFAPYVINRAYYGTFVDESLNNSGILPSEYPPPDGFSREFNQNEYSQIYYDDALITAISPATVLVSEDFNSSGYAGNWVFSDEYLGYGHVLGSGEISVALGKLFLGPAPNFLMLPGYLPVTILPQISGLLVQIEELA
jgi:hypothetical protein